MADSQQKAIHHAHHAQQPSARWCFVCGVENPSGLQIRFFNDGPFQVMARVTLGEDYQSYPGIAHGGILATILDETMGRAILAGGEAPEELAEARFMFTAKMNVRYRRSVPLNEEFTVRGRVDENGKRRVLVSGEVLLPDGTVAVEGSATLLDIPRDQIAAMLNADICWQVYP